MSEEMDFAQLVAQEDEIKLLEAENKRLREALEDCAGCLQVRSPARKDCPHQCQRGACRHGAESGGGEMKHTIKISDGERYAFDHQIAGSFGKGEHKELKAVVVGLDVHYEVWSHRKMICNTTRIAEAVTAYNRDA